MSPVLSPPPPPLRRRHSNASLLHLYATRTEQVGLQVPRPQRFDRKDSFICLTAGFGGI